MLEVRNLRASVDQTEILKGIDLEIKPGEIHALMGPNGSGKSTFAQVLAGHQDFEVTGGEVLFQNEDLLDMDPEDRARLGMFLAFQYPVEIPGVNTAYFLRTGLNEIRKARGEPEIDAIDFLGLIREKLALVAMDESFLKRSVNEGFSGGEKKHHEVLQLAVLEPRLAIMDETDSGLDIDALKIVATGINKLHSSDKSVLLVTHYQRLLNYIVPDFVHVLLEGRIVKSGGKELAMELEKHGYDWIREGAEVGA